jgi:glucose/arabinose dehydrogenase
MSPRRLLHPSVFLPLLGLCAVLRGNVTQAAEPNTLSVSEEKSGWQLLFDGETTDGWRGYRQNTISNGWVVEDGALVRQDGAGDIITTGQYEWFELSIEYKISPEGNSGIMFHVTEENDAPWQSGPEIQVQDNIDGHDPQLSGWLYQLYPSQVDATKPPGEWNQVYIRIAANGCEINMNGVRYAQFNLGSDDWNQRVEQSKFAEYEGFGAAGRGHICLQDHGNAVAYRNIKIRELPEDGSVPNPIDGTLPVHVELAFPDMEWEGWEPADDRGRLKAFRPVVITNAGDGSDRLFVADQWGVIYVFDNDPNATNSKVFLDIQDRVSYSDQQNEEGFLGLCFHPNYAENGEFFVYYTAREPANPRTSVISRFRVREDDPNAADPDSEEVIMTIDQPFWNHNGGTVIFGPDGYLYIGLGDGGAANDPFGHGQNLSTLLGDILRIDVDNPSGGNAYGIPIDNPYVGVEGARPEIYASGLRNVWRIAFDRETGVLWCGEVGQNLWEEINIIERGGNYGWNLRESMHPFGSEGVEERDDLIEPIWEYDHQVGKSITGGNVYRGTEVPELVGKYLYADYVSGKIWALTYDPATGDVTNEYIPSELLPVITFGEDEQGETYFSIVAADGQGIYKFARD